MKKVVDGERGVSVDASHADGAGGGEVVSLDYGPGESGQVVAGAKSLEAAANRLVGNNGWADLRFHRAKGWILRIGEDASRQPQEESRRGARVRIHDPRCGGSAGRRNLGTVGLGARLGTDLRLMAGTGSWVVGGIHKGGAGGGVAARIPLHRGREQASAKTSPAKYGSSCNRTRPHPILTASSPFVFP